MATKKLIMVASGPGAGAADAIARALDMSRQAQEITICLLQDAVLCALKGNETPGGAAIKRAVGEGIEVCYLEDDLAARGFGAQDVQEETTPVGYGRLVEMMLDEERQPLGAF